MSPETSLWVYFLSPVAILGAVVFTFLLGRIQGRAQTRYIKSAEYITQLRKLLLELRWNFEVLPEFEQETDDEIAVTAEVLGERVIKLVKYYETYKPWLPRRTKDRLEPGLILTIYEMGLPLMREEDEPPVSREEFIKLLAPLKDIDFVGLADKLDKEVEHLVGTLPWWQRWFGA